MVLFYNKAKINPYIILLKKKKISLNFNNKFYLRENLLTNKLVLDNEFHIIEKKNDLKFNLTVNSITLSTNCYQHNVNEKLKFNKISSNFLFNNNFLFKLLNILTKTKHALIVTTIKKGGLYAFTSGLKGFLPQSHFYKSINKILCLPQYNFQTLCIFLNKKNNILDQNKNIFFLPNFSLKLKFFLPKKTKNFNNKRKKKYKKKTKFNFVFLFYKNITI